MPWQLTEVLKLLIGINKGKQYILKYEKGGNSTKINTLLNKIENKMNWNIKNKH